MHTALFLKEQCAKEPPRQRLSLSKGHFMHTAPLCSQHPFSGVGLAAALQPGWGCRERAADRVKYQLMGEAGHGARPTSVSFEGQFASR